MSQKLKVMSAGAVEGPLHALAPEFTKAGGAEVELVFNTVGALRERFTKGEPTDVIVLSGSAIDALEKEGRFLPGSRTDLGTAAVGVAVRDGMMMPDISTPEAFKRAMLAAQSIGATDPAHGGSSGIWLVGLFERLGIADQVKDKMVLGKIGRDVGLAVATGRAELGITFTSEFVPIEGTRVVGPLPREIGFLNVYSAAIAKNGAAEPARAFLNFLTSPSSKARFKTFGLE
jgi:molybdate transport system substrate-binding protein